VRIQRRTAWADTAISVDGVVRAVTGQDGLFVVLGASAGEHVVEAWQPGTLRSRAVIVVANGRVVDLSETLLLLGDVYPNGRIDVVDYLIGSAALGRCQGDDDFQGWLDLTANGCVGPEDIQVIVDNMGRTGPTRWSPVPSP